MVYKKVISRALALLLVCCYVLFWCTAETKNETTVHSNLQRTHILQAQKLKHRATCVCAHSRKMCVCCPR